MFNSLLGLGLAIFGLYHYREAQLNPAIDTTLAFHVKYLGSILLGGGVFAYNLASNLNVTNLSSLFSKFKMPSLGVNVSKLPANIEIKTEEEQDNISLYYLTERLKTDPEALDLLRKISDKLFSLHHPVEKLPTQEGK